MKKKGPSHDVGFHCHRLGILVESTCLHLTTLFFVVSCCRVTLAAASFFFCSLPCSLFRHLTAMEGKVARAAAPYIFGRRNATEIYQRETRREKRERERRWTGFEGTKTREGSTGIMIWRRRKRAWPFRRFGSRPKSVQSDESSRLFSFLIYSVSSPPPVQFSCISFKNFGGIRKRRRPPSLTWRRVNNKMGRSHPLAAGRFSSDGSTTRLKRKKNFFVFYLVLSCPVRCYRIVPRL